MTFCRFNGTLPLKLTQNSASIGIIGGADGPTAIFVSGSARIWTLIGVIACALALIVGIVLLFKARKK